MARCKKCGTERSILNLSPVSGLCRNCIPFVPSGWGLILASIALAVIGRCLLPATFFGNLNRQAELAPIDGVVTLAGYGMLAVAGICMLAGVVRWGVSGVRSLHMDELQLQNRLLIEAMTAQIAAAIVDAVAKRLDLPDDPAGTSVS